MLPRRHQRLLMHLLPRILSRTHHRPLDNIDPRIQRSIANQRLQLTLHAQSVLPRGWRKRSRNGIQRHATKRCKELDQTLPPDGRVQRRHVPREMQIQPPIRLVRRQDAQTRRVLTRAERGDGAAHVRLELEELAEGRVLQNQGLQLGAGERGECAQPAVDCDVVAREHGVWEGERSACAAVWGGGVEGEEGWIRGKEGGRRAFVVRCAHLCEAEDWMCRREDAGCFRVGQVQALDFVDAGLDGEPVVLGDADEDQLEIELGVVFRSCAVFAHARVGFEGGGVVTDFVIKGAEIFVAHLVGWNQWLWSCKLGEHLLVCSP